MKVMIQLWRLQYELDGINLVNWCLWLLVKTSSFLQESSYTDVLCRVICYMAAKFGQ